MTEKTGHGILKSEDHHSDYGLSADVGAVTRRLVA